MVRQTKVETAEQREHALISLEKYIDRHDAHSGKATFVTPIGSDKSPLLVGILNALVPGIGYAMLRQKGKAVLAFCLWVGLIIGGVLAILGIITLVITVLVVSIIVMIPVFFIAFLIFPPLILLALPAIPLVVLLLIVGIVLLPALILVVCVLPIVHMIISGIDGYKLAKRVHQGGLLMAGECGIGLARAITSMVAHPTFTFHPTAGTTPAISRRCNALSLAIKRFDIDSGFSPSPSPALSSSRSSSPSVALSESSVSASPSESATSVSSVSEAEVAPPHKHHAHHAVQSPTLSHAPSHPDAPFA